MEFFFLGYRGEGGRRELEGGPKRRRFAKACRYLARGDQGDKRDVRKIGEERRVSSRGETLSIGGKALGGFA